MNERVVESGNRLILYEAGMETVPDERWLQPDWWRAQAVVLGQLGGRGGALHLQTPLGQAVLRRYYRGGWMAPLLKDRYLRLGASRSRGFREFRLLTRLKGQGLPVPEPLLASFEPGPLFYRAGLLTRYIPRARPLADVASDLASAEWAALARVLQRFFSAGLLHPDLNAHNLLMDVEGRWHLLDFDRARLLDQPVAAGRMIRRLERSLCKLGETGWRPGFSTHLLRLG